MRLVTWCSVNKTVYSLMKGQFNIKKDRIEILISCSTDKIGPEKRSWI